MSAALRVVPSPFVLPGHVALDQVRDFVARFNSFPSHHCAPMLALWYAHTWVAEHFYVTPRLILSSAEPGSGKTRALEIAQHLTKAPEMTFSGSAPALFRMVGAGPITILFDEIDAVFSAKAGGNEEVRALLNAGYKRSATIPRCKGDTSTGITVERIPVFAPVALAGLAGAMPATITTRAITIHLRKRRLDEHVDHYHERRTKMEAEPIRDALSAWVTSIGESLGDALPEMPDGVADRSAEIWECLLAIADAAGGHWPETARAACLHFVKASHESPPTLGVRLLADLRALFTEAGTDRMHTTEILSYLLAQEDAPWGDLWGKALDARRLAKELDRYQVRPTTILRNGVTGKGYYITPTVKQVGLCDAWERYLPAVSSIAQENEGEQ